MQKCFITPICFFLHISSAFYFHLYPRLIIINGYAAKIACSCYFVRHLPEKRITEEELGYFPVSLSRFKIDETTKSVTATFGDSENKPPFLRRDMDARCSQKDRKSVV